jgi:hypothetical protein
VIGKAVFESVDTDWSDAVGALFVTEMLIVAVELDANPSLTV